jgi:(p)ppGpp synthase/HD superfamily hydrolase
MNEKTIDYWIERAKQIAIQAHEGQKRRGGQPYIEHPLRVANEVENGLKPIAFLHDVCEDSNITLYDLQKEGFPQYIIDAVDLLTHKKEDTNVQYWIKIAKNPDAVEVKLKDIKDNLGDNPNERQKQKYVKALDLFKKLGVSS